MDDNEWIELEGTVEYATAKAILFYCHFWEKSEWLPRSQIEIEEVEGNGHVKVRIKAWLAKKNNWTES